MQQLTHSVVAALLLVLMTLAQNVEAKIYLSHPTAENGDEVWYRSYFNVESVPDSASLTISTAGYVLVYVNGRIAFPETIWPYRAVTGVVNQGDSLPPRKEYRQGMATRDIDIKPLLRYGRNVLAVWYAPCGANTARLLPQIAAVLTMRKGNDSAVVVDDNSSWLCHLATSKITPWGEDDDAPEYNPNWKRDDIHTDPSWVAPQRLWVDGVSWNTIDDVGLMACRTIVAKANASTDTTQIFYPPAEVTGQLKVTMRGTRKGQQLLVNGMRYRCLGVNDEQFITRFATVTAESIEIKNTSGRIFPDVQSVEIVELKPTKDSSKEVPNNRYGILTDE